jgi:hypothetical protein
MGENSQYKVTNGPNLGRKNAGWEYLTGFVYSRQRIQPVLKMHSPVENNPWMY